MLCRCAWQDGENAQELTTLLSDLYHSLQMRYEISTTYAPTIACDYGSDPGNLKQFKILVGTPRQPTSYEEKLKVVYDNRRHMASCLSDVASLHV